MKIVYDPEKFKVVEYFEWSISIPSHHNYIAADYSGIIYSYSSKPMIDLDYNVFSNIGIEYHLLSTTYYQVDSILFQYDNDKEWINTLKYVGPQ
jgi:hypothetical protein